MEKKEILKIFESLAKDDVTPTPEANAKGKAYTLPAGNLLGEAQGPIRNPGREGSV